MDKRYQIFVSSTYADLKDERQKVMQALMEMDCIPAGMELFPAADDEQWQFIKRVIDDCDYYLLIVGGRYGSLTSTGISYTEQEFDYAEKKGIRIIALLHEKPDELAVNKSDIDPILRDKLIAFRERVAANRLVRFWISAEQLPGLVALSLSKTIKSYPAVGWVRANQVANVAALTELNDLRKKNAELELEIAELRALPQDSTPDLAPLSDKVAVGGKHSSNGRFLRWSGTLSWEEVFGLVAPHLLSHPSDSEVRRHLSEGLHEKTGQSGYSATLDDQVFQTLKIQLVAHGLVSVEYSPAVNGGMGLFWALTPRGHKQMMKLRTVRPSGG